MAVLVCGGAGYIGSHMTAALIEKGYEAVVADNLEKGHREAVWPGAKFYEGDLRDSAFMDKILTENNITAAVDFAAYSIVPESVADPIKYYENNIYGTLCLVKSLLKHGIKKLVFSSTAAVYGIPGRIPITEDVMPGPINPYGETKLAVEKMLKWFGSAYGFKYIALRYFNVAGAHESGRIGEDHNPETHLIPMTLQAALGNNPALEMFGDDYPTPDKTCIRDYIHVMDLADAHILALEKLEKGGDSDVYNLGSGEGFSNKEIIDAARRVSGVDFPVKVCGRRPGDPPLLIASSEKITRELGWNPARTNLDTIMRTAWAWHTSYPGGFKAGKSHV